MKHGKTPTRKQKIVIRQNGLNPNEWLVTKSVADKLEVVHRKNNAIKILES